MTFLESLLILIGRICISGFFFWSVAEKVKKWHHTVTIMKAKNIPQPNIVLPIAIAVKTIGAVFLLVGFLPRLGALLLIFLLLPSAIRFHDFWTHHGVERAVEQNLFMKDLAIVGGLLIILAMGAGKFAING